MPKNASTSPIKIRRARMSDKQAVFSFLADAYAEKGRYKIPERWDWQFIENPFRPKGLLPVWLAVRGKEVVGQIGAMHEPLKHGNREILLSWAVDLIVLPECRGQNLGGKLYAALCADNDLVMNLRMADFSRRALISEGGVLTNPVGVFVRPAQHDEPSTLLDLWTYLERRRWGKRILSVIRWLQLDRLMTMLVNMSVWAADRRSRRDMDAGIDFLHVDRFGQEADAFWESVKPDYPIIVQRTSTFLNWKYAYQPHTQYDLVEAYRGGEMCGYVILRKTRPPESNTGIIADLLTARQDTQALSALVAQAITLLQGRGVEAIEAASTEPEYQKVFRKHGFLKKKAWTPVCQGKLIRTDKDGISQGWFLGRSDSDSDQYPYE